MRNTFPAVFMLIILAACLGCGILDRAHKSVTGSENLNSNSNKTLTDRAVDTVVGEDRIGVPECDEVMDFLSTQANNPDDNILEESAKKMALNKFRQEIKRRVEEQKADKVELAKTCREFKRNLDTSKADEESNKQ